MIQINKRHMLEWETGLTVADVLQRMNYTFPHIIVSVNGEIVRQEAYDDYVIPDEADVRVIHLIAGG
ncbi:MAG: sulfur carrier protein ThiS [Anaerolineae bacterium]|jgi:sulfur carrier protein